MNLKKLSPKTLTLLLAISIVSPRLFGSGDFDEASTNLSPCHLMLEALKAAQIRDKNIPEEEGNQRKEINIVNALLLWPQYTPVAKIKTWLKRITQTKQKDRLIYDYLNNPFVQRSIDINTMLSLLKDHSPRVRDDRWPDRRFGFLFQLLSDAVSERLTAKDIGKILKSMSDFGANQQTINYALERYFERFKDKHLQFEEAITFIAPHVRDTNDRYSFAVQCAFQSMLYDAKDRLTHDQLSSAIKLLRRIYSKKSIVHLNNYITTHLGGLKKQSRSRDTIGDIEDIEDGEEGEEGENGKHD